TKNADNPLNVAALSLAQYLAAQLMHSGLNLDDSIRLHTPSGFSVHGSGRLRVDCVLFSELGHEVLKDIPGLTFQYISLRSRENPVSISVSKPAAKETQYYKFDTPESFDDPSGSKGLHLILMVVDENNHHLIIDNESVRYFDAEDPMAFFKGIYRDEYREYCIKDSSDARCATGYGWGADATLDYRPF
ncbi:MAG: hypothetical protein Q8P84_01415, partial [Deltaproteobacteria bacterium]|nr:hypothetical protein [Deltaproteobacteria bacterium]